MKLVTVDFETYYDKDYTLTKLSTSEYVRDPRFEVLSAGIKIDGGPTKVYFGKKDVKTALSKIDWDKAAFLAHHAHFDGLIMSHHFGIVPKVYACTLSMGRALHPKADRNDLATITERYAEVAHKKLAMPPMKGRHLESFSPEELEAVREYNAGDVDATHDVYHVMLERFPAKELELIDVTVRMFADPVLVVDMDLAKKELRREQRLKRKAIKDSGAAMPVLSSNGKFVKALEALGIEVPTKTSKTTGLEIPAVAKSDDALQALLLHPDQRVVKLVEGRLAAKSTQAESRALRMLARGKDGMRLPIYLNYAGAHTFRWSGGDKFNPQNFKQAKKLGGALRKAMRAPKGYVLVVVDAAQIEARIVAWLAGEAWVVEAFREGRDLYSEFASKAYGRIITKMDKEERFVGKTCVLGLGFQMGGPKLQVTLLTQSINQGLEPVRMELPVCYRLVNTYRTECKRIKGLWDFMNDRGISAMLSLQEGEEFKHKSIVFEKGAVRLPNGLRLLYPGLSANLVHRRRALNPMFKLHVNHEDEAEGIQDATYLTVKGRSKLYGGLLTENIVQALARIIVADVMLELSKTYRIVMMTHDEIVFVAKKRDAKQALAHAMELMKRPPKWGPDLPLNSEGGYDESYSK